LPLCTIYDSQKCKKKIIIIIIKNQKSIFTHERLIKNKLLKMRIKIATSKSPPQYFDSDLTAVATIILTRQ
jgi:hypothetical protein